MIVMPPMPPGQTASWLGVLDLYDHLGKGWTLIGGQLVHLYCAERGQFPVRPTNDVDAVIDVRADPNLVGALVVKAAAHGNAGDPGVARHRRDFVVLAGLVTTADFANEQLTRKDRQRLRLIVTAIENDRELLLEIPGATAVIERLKVAAK
jgi:hypothetical protein